MPTVAVLPVKSFRLGKRRLAERLSPDTRTWLGRALAQRTAEMSIEAGLIPLIVAGDGEVAEWSLGQALPCVLDPGDGLSAAAASGAAWAGQSASPWVVIHCDLPLLQVSELSELEDVRRAQGSVIAPSSDGGTSAMGGRGVPDFAYGPGSFHRHLSLDPGAGILTRLGLLHDLDSTDDLESVRAHPRGRWLQTALG